MDAREEGSEIAMVLTGAGRCYASRCQTDVALISGLMQFKFHDNDEHEKAVAYWREYHW